MGNGMNKVLPGLYVGNYRDSKDHQQLNKYQITHIIAIHDSPRRLLPDKHYLCVMAADTPDQNLSQYFSVCNDFIHAARLRDGNVLIHCLAGMSRSVTVAVAYIMTATNLNWKEALKVVRAGRAVANPNTGFQTQLQDFEMYRLAEERRRLRERFPSIALEQLDRSKCMAALDNYAELLQNKDICEGNCTRGVKCPTGVCNMDPSKGLFRRRPSNASTSASTRSRLRTPATNSTVAQSCPTSPKHSPTVSRRSLGEQKILEDEEMAVDVITAQRQSDTPKIEHQASTSEAAAYAAAIIAAKDEQKLPQQPHHHHQKQQQQEQEQEQQQQDQKHHQQQDLQHSQHSASKVKKSPTTSVIPFKVLSGSESSASETESNSSQVRVSSAGSRMMTTRLERADSITAAAAAATQLQRSASTTSSLANMRPRSIPGGLYSYTGYSTPSSMSVHGSRVDLRDNDRGSVIYLGCSAPRSSMLSLSSRGSSTAGSSPPTPAPTPPVSPRHGVRRSNSSIVKKTQQKR